MNRTTALKILGLSSSASTDDLKKSHRRLVMQHHPDRAGGDAEKFRQTQEAYEYLNKNGIENDDPLDFNDYIRSAAWSSKYNKKTKEPTTIARYVDVPIDVAFKGGEVRYHDVESPIKINPGLKHGALVHSYSRDNVIYNVYSQVDEISTFGSQFRFRFNREADHKNGLSIVDGEISMRVVVSKLTELCGGNVLITGIDGVNFNVKIPPRKSSGLKLLLKGKGFWSNDQLTERGDCTLIIEGKFKPMSDYAESELREFIKLSLKEIKSRKDS